MLNLGLIGANGRMGQEITHLVASQPNNYTLTAAIVSNSTKATPELTKAAIIISHDLAHLNNVEVVIDFSSPKTSLEVVAACLNHKIPLVIGTTGFTQEEYQIIEAASQQIPVLVSPNMSLSVNVLFKLASLVATKLPDFEAEIIEAHHRHKKDAPSGTAIKLGELIAQAREIEFTSHAKYSRHGISEARHKNDIGFGVIRGGDIVGMHDVLFIGEGETLHLTSEITNRSSFAHGALLAASFLADQPPGLYNMFDALKL
ncbi:MAG: 4-hydroxy-tetrahydrodipicolinate reductase [Burkholderiales bacterium]